MIKETKTHIYSKKVNKPIKLLVFSDIHYSGEKDIKKLEYLYENVKKYDVDYICIPGDIVDIQGIKYDYLIKWLMKLGKIHPVILSLGNHDIRKKKKSFFDKDLWDKIEEIDNVFLLNNTCKSFKDIYFFGFTQSYNYYHEYLRENKKLMQKEIEEHGVCDRMPNKFSVLLMHSPICIKDKIISTKLNEYDLILSGHMHNGVVPPILDEIFDNNVGIVAPNKTLFPKVARGIIKKDNTIVISSGVTKISSNTGRLLRFLNIFFPIGINYIKISNEKKDDKKEIRYYR